MSMLLSPPYMPDVHVVVVAPARQARGKIPAQWHPPLN